MDKRYITHKREVFFQIAKDLIKKNSKVLDIGSGNGSFAEYCERPDIYMLEGNSESAYTLKLKYTNVYESRLPSIPFENDMFDLIHMSHVIEHLEPEEVYQTLVEFDRCCKKDGYLVISAPLMWEGFYDDLSHIKPYQPYIFKKYLCGFGSDNFSRPAISKNYNVERLTYRYKERYRLFAIKNSKKLFDRFIFKIYNLLKIRGFKEYRKTGYTIVLKKLK